MFELGLGVDIFETNADNLYSKIKNILPEKWIIKKNTDNKNNTSDLINLDNKDKEIVVIKEDFEDIVSSSVNKYIEKYNTLFLTKSIPTLLRYGNNQEFSNHVDDHPHLDRRRISLIYYLNDDYSGGEIEFPRLGIKIKPKPGNVLMFPSTYVYNHIVHPVIDGTRYCIVQWYC